MKMSFAMAILLIIPTLLFAHPLVAMFNQEPEVLRYGVMYILRLEMPFYLALCVNQIYASSLRGAGNTKALMIIHDGLLHSVPAGISVCGIPYCRFSYCHCFGISTGLGALQCNNILLLPFCEFGKIQNDSGVNNRSLK